MNYFGNKNAGLVRNSFPVSVIMVQLLLKTVVRCYYSYSWFSGRSLQHWNHLYSYFASANWNPGSIEYILKNGLGTTAENK